MLYEHQKTGIEFLKKAKKAILADEMGLGKTRQSVLAAGELTKGVLVVCPASLKINWQREIKEVYPEDQVAIISTTGEMANPWNTKWFIINYDILEKMSEYIEMLVDEGKIKALILDEAHYIKGKSIRTACMIGGWAKKKEGDDIKKFKMTGIAHRMDIVYALTGTPIMNRPIEMFNILRAIGHELGCNRSYFAKRYCGAYLKTVFRRYGPPLRFVDESGATNLDELREKLKGCMIRRKKNEVLNLPEKIIGVMECEMTDEWRKKYDRAWDDYVEFLEKEIAGERFNEMMEKAEFMGEELDEDTIGKIRDMNNKLMARQLVEAEKLNQICSYSKTKRIISDIANAAEQGEKVLVFTRYKKTIEDIMEGLKEKKIKSVRLTGEDKMTERQKSVDKFQNDEKVMAFVANIKAAGVGLNLTKAGTVIFADMDWSPETHRQAEDRAHRIGQKGTVNVYYYICTETTDEDRMEVLKDKKQVIDQVIDGTKKTVRRRSTQQEFLMRMKEKVINRPV